MTAPASFFLEFDLPPDQAGRVFRHKAVSRHRIRRTRTDETAITWHDAPAELSHGGALLARDDGAWTLQRTIRRHGWPAGTETSANGATAHVPSADDALPRTVAALQGRTRRVELAPDEADAPVLALSLLQGTLRNVTEERVCCRLRVEGAPAAAARFALLLGETLPLAPSRLSLHELAREIGGGAAPPAHEPPAPEVEPDADADEAMAGLFGSLSAALLLWLTRLGAFGATGADVAAIEPRAVHQARVATRRLRSALIVFAGPLGGSLAGLEAPLKALAATLGQARDWDVFLLDTGAALAASLPDDRRIAALLADAETARAAAHAEVRRMLARPAARRLVLHLSLLSSLRPWREAPQDQAREAPQDQAREAAQDQARAAAQDEARAAEAGAREDAEPAAPAWAQPVRALAPDLLDRRFRKLTRVGKHLDGLDHDALHSVRKTAKKLRYTLEFLAPTLPRGDTRRLLKRLSALQDQLGALNDTAVGATLMERIAPGAQARGPGGHEFASGAVAGWLAARAAASSAELHETWRAVRHTEKFWRS